VIVHIREAVEGPCAELFSWWTDYTDQDSVDSIYMKVSRRVLSREGNVVRMEDTFTWPLHFTDLSVAVLNPPGEVAFESESRLWNISGRYRMRDEGSLCILEGMIELRPKGVWRIILNIPPARCWIRRGIMLDTRKHVNDFISDRLKGEGRAGAG
jgi:hypothetical protein